MGWDGEFGNWKSAAAFFNEAIKPKIIGDIVDCEVVGDTGEFFDNAAAFAAVVWPGKQDPECLVVLLRHYRNKPDQYLSKWEEKSMGPIDHRCPRRIIDQLGVAPNDWADEWRGKCREYTHINEQTISPKH